MRSPLLLGVLMVSLLGVLTWLWSRRSTFSAYRSPRGDPGASRWPEDSEQLLGRVLGGTLTEEEDEHAAVAATYEGDFERAASIFRLGGNSGGIAWVASRLCDDGSGRPYRDGLRRALQSLDGVDGPWATLARARIALGLGEPDRAETLLDTLPPDWPHACEVRAWVYASRDDRRRARSALYAAIDGSTGIVRIRRQELLDAWTGGILPP